MAKNLVIVESPAKVKSIHKFLGSNYTVKASMGHVRDLPKSQMGIDVENGCTPKYITIRGKGELLADLRKSARSADTIYLATDPDREGEAISWHLMAALKEPEEKFKRISFNEITKSAVKASLKSPRNIDMDLVNAQQARRIIDRLVGYEISPILWEKVKRGLSAGRVQSVALKIIADREQEINDFIPQEYWTIDAFFGVPGSKKTLEASFYGNSKKMTVASKEEVDKIIAEVKASSPVVSEVKNGERTKKAPFPFTTSTLQQEASKKLNFSTLKTMRIAQQLYEGVTIKGQGTVGLISYLRTDSTRISDEARAMAETFINDEYGKEYLGVYKENKRSGSRVQDAHEAIRPTDINRLPVDIKDSLTRDQARLYQLIWERFTASQMADAVYSTQSVKVKTGKYVFNASASQIKFKGFQSVYSIDDEKNKALSVVPKTGDELKLSNITPEQHFTQPPAHFTEASLVKALEELGVGRPSTYAPTISTILARRYVTKEQKNIFITELGEVVNDIMKKSFPMIVDESFTANLETLFDGIEAGEDDWHTVVENFYPDLDIMVKKAHDELDKVKIEDEVTDEVCELCGANMVIKYGSHGKFLACPRFPECRNTKPYYEKTGIKCPLCGKDVVIKRTRKGRKYYGCIDNPDCEFMSWQKPSDKKCPKCGSYMVEKGKNLVCANNECGHKETM